jgi:hypothetical protein
MPNLTGLDNLNLDTMQIIVDDINLTNDTPASPVEMNTRYQLLLNYIATLRKHLVDLKKDVSRHYYGRYNNGALLGFPVDWVASNSGGDNTVFVTIPSSYFPAGKNLSNCHIIANPVHLANSATVSGTTQTAILSTWTRTNTANLGAYTLHLVIDRTQYGSGAIAFDLHLIIPLI